MLLGWSYLFAEMVALISVSLLLGVFVGWLIFSGPSKEDSILAEKKRREREKLRERIEELEDEVSAYRNAL